MNWIQETMQRPQREENEKNPRWEMYDGMSPYGRYFASLSEDEKKEVRAQWSGWTDGELRTQNFERRGKITFYTPMYR